VDEIGKVNVAAELARLGLNEHLSSQRSNGLRAMVTRVVQTAAAAA
jgi:cysteine desulfuration protein SufE